MLNCSQMSTNCSQIIHKIQEKNTNSMDCSYCGPRPCRGRPRGAAEGATPGAGNRGGHGRVLRVGGQLRAAAEGAVAGAGNCGGRGRATACGDGGSSGRCRLLRARVPAAARACCHFQNGREADQRPTEAIARLQKSSVGSKENTRLSVRISQL